MLTLFSVIVFSWQHNVYVASLLAQTVKNLPAAQETWFQRPGLRGSLGGGHGNPSQVFLPGESHGQRSLESYIPWSPKEFNRTERLTNTHIHAGYIQKSIYTQWTFTVWRHMCKRHPDQQKYISNTANPQVCQGPAPAGPGIPKGWVASARKKTDTHRRLHRGGSFLLFLGQLSFYRMNVTSPLSHHILHQILVSCFCQYFSLPCFSPMHSSRTFPITGLFLKCPVHSLLASMA